VVVVVVVTLMIMVVMNVLMQSFQAHHPTCPRSWLFPNDENRHCIQKRGALCNEQRLKRDPCVNVE